MRRWPLWRGGHGCRSVRNGFEIGESPDVTTRYGTVPDATGLDMPSRLGEWMQPFKGALTARGNM
jgi:hypothetical protein